MHIGLLLLALILVVSVLGCNHPEAKSAETTSEAKTVEQNVQVVRAWVAAFQARDPEAMAKYMSPDYSHEVPVGTPSVKGLKAVMDYYRQQFEQYPDLRFEYEIIAASGDKVVIEGTNIFTDEGKTVQVKEIGWARVKGGKIVFYRGYFGGSDS